MTGDDQRLAQAQVGPFGDRTMEQAVARELRRLIVEGTRRPGDRLRYRDLAQEFGVSVTPVRIALRELANEGLVELRPHEGARVSPLSREDLEELYATRIGIETWLTLRGVEGLGDADFTRMADLFEAADRAAREGSREDYLHDGWQYRCVCYEAAGRPKLLGMAQVLFERSARYQALTLDVPERLEESRTFLHEFDAACRAQDGRRAALALMIALERAVEHIIQGLASTRDALR